MDELRESYGITNSQLLRGLPELMKGEALLLYRNSRDAWRSWGDFTQEFWDYFLPRQYQTQLRREVQGRIQRPGKTYQKFSTNLATIMRRAGGYSREEQLDILYENMIPRYQLYIPRKSVDSPGELLRCATDIECIEARSTVQQTATRIPAAAATTYDHAKCCWRCEQRGQTRFDCKQPPRRFCSQCGKDGRPSRSVQ